MTIQGKVGSFTRNEERARTPGHEPVILVGKVKANNGTYPTGLLLTRLLDELIALAVIAAEVLGVGGAAATPVAAEVLAAGDGTIAFFPGLLANNDIEPGSVVIAATVGAAAVAMIDDGVGGLAGAAGAGTIDYASGMFTLVFATAPDNATNVTGDYSHTPPAKAFAGTLAAFPVEPGTVVITDGVEEFTDDGHGLLTGDAGGTGTINYATGAYTLSFAVAVLPATDIEADYITAFAGVLDQECDTTQEGSGLYVGHGTVSTPVLKVGIVAPADPSPALLMIMQQHGVYPA